MKNLEIKKALMNDINNEFVDCEKYEIRVCSYTHNDGTWSGVELVIDDEYYLFYDIDNSLLLEKSIDDLTKDESKTILNETKKKLTII